MLRSSLSKVFGTLAYLLIALFIFVGRWTPGRLDAGGATDMYLEPRLWIVVLLTLTLLMQSWIEPGRRGVFDRRTRISLVLSVSFLVYTITTVAWAYDPTLGLYKAYELSLMLAVVVSVHVLRSRGESASALWMSIALLSGALGLAGLVATASSSGRLAVLGGGPNTFGRLMGLLIVIGAVSALRGRGKLLWIAAGALAMTLLLLTGSRGALFATTTGVAVALLYAGVRWYRVLLSAGVVAVGGALMLGSTTVGKAAAAAFEQRVVKLTIEDKYTSGRDVLFDDAIALWAADPLLGAGLASFPAQGLGVYPHNIFLEVLAEGGVVGATLLVALLFWSGRELVRRKVPVDAVGAGIAALTFVGAQVSGDLYDQRGLLIAMPLIVAVSPALQVATRRRGWAHTTAPGAGLLSPLGAPPGAAVE